MVCVIVRITKLHYSKFPQRFLLGGPRRWSWQLSSRQSLTIVNQGCGRVMGNHSVIPMEMFIWFNMRIKYHYVPYLFHSLNWINILNNDRIWRATIYKLQTISQAMAIPYFAINTNTDTSTKNNISIIPILIIVSILKISMILILILVSMLRFHRHWYHYWYWYQYNQL